MKETEYRKAVDEAMVDAGVGHRMATSSEAVAVAMRLPIEVLKAIIAGDVTYDGSVLTSYNGPKIPFNPSWIAICEEEIIDRAILGES